MAKTFIQKLSNFAEDIHLKELGEDLQHDSTISLEGICKIAPADLDDTAIADLAACLQSQPTTAADASAAVRVLETVSRCSQHAHRMNWHIGQLKASRHSGDTVSVSVHFIKQIEDNVKHLRTAHIVAELICIYLTGCSVQVMLLLSQLDVKDQQPAGYPTHMRLGSCIACRQPDQLLHNITNISSSLTGALELAQREQR
jgi:hypothetical protein